MGSWLTIEKLALGRTPWKHDLDELSQFDDLRRQTILFEHF